LSSSLNRIAGDFTGIGATISGGDIASPVAIGDSALTIKTTATAPAGNSEDDQFIIGFTIADSASVGSRELNLNYTVDANFVPAPTTMQAMTDYYCVNKMEVYTNNGDDDKLLTLADTRNDQDYLVGKLADGNCWMLNNLKLGSFDDDITLTPDDSNVTADWVLPKIDNTTDGLYVFDAPFTYAYVTGQTGFDAAKPNSEEEDIYSANFAGYYYSWCAATAGTVDTTCTPPEIMPSDATQDVCPANWRMPKGGELEDTNNEFSLLAFKMAGLTDFDDYVNNFDPYDSTLLKNFLFSGSFRGILAGFGISSYWGLSGEQGLVRSASSYSLIETFGLYFHDIALVPQDRSLRLYGHSVRCLLQ
jgi:hypothetical protein